MKQYWDDKRQNGKPLQPGTVAYVMDPEDGTIPIYTYGNSQEEVMEKVGLTAMHARLSQNQRSQSQQRTPTTEKPIELRKKMTPNEIFQATEDAKNPATAGPAMAKLVADATGVDLTKLAAQSFIDTCEAWEASHPEFYDCPTNEKLIIDQCKEWTRGDITLISGELLTRAFTTLRDLGFLVERPIEIAPSAEEVEDLTVRQPLPVERQVQRVDGQRSERPMRQGTGIPSRQFTARQAAPPRGPKYTKEQIDGIPLKKMKELIQSNDKDYAESCEYWYPTEERASA